MLIKRRRQEHPSNQIAEFRAQQTALRKYKTDQKRHKVYLRLAALRKIEQKRRKMILLHIMCQEELAEKLREYMCEERRVNREADVSSIHAHKYYPNYRNYVSLFIA